MKFAKYLEKHPFQYGSHYKKCNKILFSKLILTTIIVLISLFNKFLSQYINYIKKNEILSRYYKGFQGAHNKNNKIIIPNNYEGTSTNGVWLILILLKE